MCGKMKRVRLSSQVRKTFRGSTRGFTLIEVVIAIAILGTIAITFLGALSTSSLALITADQRATAESLARSQMEYVKNQQYKSNNSTWGGQVPYDSISVPGVTGAGLYSIWSYNRTNAIVPGVVGVPWDSNTTQPYQLSTADNGIQRIKLVIKYGNDTIITLEGYKRRAGG
jgi:prepilin-type N-terminal cleavage/methylation domain-containing protein